MLWGQHVSSTLYISDQSHSVSEGLLKDRWSGLSNTRVELPFWIMYIFIYIFLYIILLYYYLYIYILL